VREASAAACSGEEEERGREGFMCVCEYAMVRLCV